MYQAATDGLESWYVHIERDPGGHPCLQNCHLLTAKTGQQNVVIRHFVIYFGKFGLFFEKLFWTVVKDKASVFLKLSQNVLPSSPCDRDFRWMNDRLRLTVGHLCPVHLRQNYQMIIQLWFHLFSCKWSRSALFAQNTVLIICMKRGGIIIGS